MNNKLTHIIKACLQLDYSAQKELYDLSVDRLYYAVKRYVKEPYFIENILQDTFIKIFKHLDTYDPEKGAFSTWSNTIAIREALLHLRKKSLEFVPLENMHLDFAGDLDPILAKMDADEIITLIDKIPAKYKIIFNLYEIDGYSHKEIAEMIKITTSTSRSYLTRAKKMIQQEIGFCVN